MVTETRQVEVFVGGCFLCDEAIRLVEAMACPSCEVRVYDLRAGYVTNDGREKAARYGVTAVPTVAVNGTVLDCCRRGPIDASVLRAAGIGQV